MADNSQDTSGYGAYGQASSLAGGLLGGIQGFYQPFIQQNWAGNATRAARHFAQYMAKHQYQFAVKDLRKAGLNPLLAYTQGGASAASVPPSQVPSFDSSGDIIGRVASGAKAGSEIRAALHLLQNQIKLSDMSVVQEGYRTEQERENVFLNQANSARAAAEAKSAEAQRDILNATKSTQIGLKGVELQKLRQDLELQRQQLPSAKAQADFDRSDAGQTLNYLRRVVDVIRP